MGFAFGPLVWLASLMKKMILSWNFMQSCTVLEWFVFVGGH